LIEDIVDTLSGCEELDTTLRWYILIVISLAVIALVFKVWLYIIIDDAVFRASILL
jgi:hypothetical protein